MKKEFGKWLMDVAKYMVTALLLSTIFADLNEPIIIYIVVILSIVVLLIGLLLVSDVHLYEDIIYFTYKDWKEAKHNSVLSE